MLKFEDLPESIIPKIKGFYAGNIPKIGLLKYFFSSLYIHCRKQKTKSDDLAMQEVWKIVFAGNRDRHIFQDLAKIVEKFLSIWQFKEPAEEPARLLVTPEWLKGWFYLKICSDREDRQSLNIFLNIYRTGRQYSPEEILAFLEHLAVLGLSLMHWMDLSNWIADKREPRDYPHRGMFAEVPQGPRAQMTAILYLIAEYAHIEGGLVRKAELFKTLEEIWANEAVLYTIRDTYRDHINHMVETCLLGLLLMDLKQEGTPAPYFNRLYSEFDRQPLIRNWILTALLHDTGYALEILRRSGQPLKFMDAPRLKEFAGDFEDWFKSNETDALARINQCLGKALDWLEGHGLRKFDHGVISAYFTLFLVTDRTKDQKAKDQRIPDQKWREDIRPALDAMARHNLKRLKTSYGPNPLAFLLILCDHLQEWDRPLVGGTEMRHSLVVNFVGKAWNGIDTDSMVQYLAVENVLFQEGGISMSGSTGPSFTLHFRESGKDRIHPPTTWLSHTYDLQTLTDAPGKIAIRLVHPVRAGRGPEMDVFQTFLRRHADLAGLRDWAIQSRRGDDWFKYEVEWVTDKHPDPVRKIKPGEYEIFTFQLTQCETEIIISEIPEGYIGKYMDFWKERFPSN